MELRDALSFLATIIGIALFLNLPLALLVALGAAEQGNLTPLYGLAAASTLLALGGVAWLTRRG